MLRNTAFWRNRLRKLELRNKGLMIIVSGNKWISGGGTDGASSIRFNAISVILYFICILLFQFFCQIHITHTMHVRHTITNQLIDLWMIKKSNASSSESPCNFAKHSTTRLYFFWSKIGLAVIYAHSPQNTTATAPSLYGNKFVDSAFHSADD